MWQAADWLLLLEGHGAEAMDSTSMPSRWLQHHLPLLSIFLPPGSALTGPSGKMLEQREYKFSAECSLQKGSLAVSATTVRPQHHKVYIVTTVLQPGEVSSLFLCPQLSSTQMSAISHRASLRLNFQFSLATKPCKTVLLINDPPSSIAMVLV